MRLFRSLRFLALLAIVAGQPFACAADDAPITEPPSTAGEPCVRCIAIRVGLPRIVRGPSLEIADNHLTEIHLRNGRFRGFDAHSDTHAIDGSAPWDMGGPARTVLTHGAAGSFDSCGQWLNHAETIGDQTIGLIHDETDCHYQNHGETHKSMSIATSGDEGLTWHQLGQVITGPDASMAGHESGEGDCTAVNGHDGFLYAYCDRARDRALFVARAPVGDLGPGRWKKFDGGTWDQPGLGGSVTRIGSGSGASVARWTTTGEFVLTGWVPGGVGLFLSSNHTTLSQYPEPVLPLDGAAVPAAQADHVVYMELLDAKDGSNQLSNAWSLVYAYWPSREARDQKYLVFRDVTVVATKTASNAPVGILLGRWYDAATHDRWSTTAPVPGNYTTYRPEKTSGYLLTTAPTQGFVEVEDCVAQRPGHPDHLLSEKGFCESRGYQRLRTAGWAYAQAQPGTMPLYRCYDAASHAHFAANTQDCDALGVSERLLGYVLKE